MDNRYDNRQSRNNYGRNYDRYDRQSEQFEQRSPSQQGEMRYSDNSDDRYMERSQRDWPSDSGSQSRSNRGMMTRGNERGNSSYDAMSYYERDDGRAPRGSYGYGSDAGGHGSFTGDSYGGEAIHGAASFFPQMPGGRSYDRYDRNDRMRTASNDRGFFAKAGDEIASWFGDEDAERRRDMDHRGRGPNNYNRSSERIMEDACDRLTDDRGVDARNIDVSVDDGEITLNGTVNTLWEKRRAEDSIYNVSGVKHVQNNLRLAETEMRAGTSPQGREVS